MKYLSSMSVHAERRILKRRCGAIVFSVLISLLVTDLALGEELVIPSSVDQSILDQASAHYRDGDVQRAIPLLIEYVESIDFVENKELAWYAVTLLYQFCFAPGMPGYSLGSNPDCHESARTFLAKLQPENYEDAQRVKFLATWMVIAEQNREAIEWTFSEGVLDDQEYIYDWAFYIRRQLLASEGYLLLKEHERAKLSADKALSAILSIQNSSANAWQVSRWLLGAINLYTQLKDYKTAQVLYFSTIDSILASLATDSTDTVAAHILGSTLAVETGHFDASIFHANELLSIISRSEKIANLEPILRADALLLKALACLLSGDIQCARSSVQDDEFDALISSFSDEFSSLEHFSAALFLTAKVTVAAFTGNSLSGVADQYITFLEKAVSVSPTPEATEHLSFGLAELYLLTNREEEAHELLVSISQSSLNRFNEVSVALPGHALLATRSEKLLWYLTLASLAKKEDLANDESDLALRLIEALTRSNLSSNGNALALMAGASNDLEKSITQQFLRAFSRQQHEFAVAAKSLGEDLTSAASIPNDNSPPSSSIDFAELQHLASLGTQTLHFATQLPKSTNAVPNLPSLLEIQSHLAADEALFVNLGMPSHRVAVCVRSGDFQLKSYGISDGQQLLNDQRLIKLALMGTYPPSPNLDSQFPAAAAHRLFQNFIAPVYGCIREADTVYTIGDQGGLPLETLLTAMPNKIGNGYDLSNAEWVLGNFNVAYLGSVRELLAIKIVDSRNPESANFWGVGNPFLQGFSTNGVTVQEHMLKGSLGAGLSSISELPALPETALELQSAIDTLGGQGKVLLGKDATEIAVRKANLSKYRYLSFATHGLVKQEIPGINEAALVLTPGDMTDQHDDGVLLASELADFSLNAKVAVLSACNTANTDTEVFSSEVLGLTTALATAGTPASVVTLTAVDSNSTRLIVEKFYEYLSKDTTSVARALAQAKRDLVSAPPSIEYSHPRFWAPIVVYGNSRNLPDVEGAGALNWSQVRYFGEPDSEVLNIVPNANGDAHVVYVERQATEEALATSDGFQTVVSKLDNDFSFLWERKFPNQGNTRSLVPLDGSLIFPSVEVLDFDLNDFTLTTTTHLNSLNGHSGNLTNKYSFPRTADTHYPIGGVSLDKDRSLLAFYLDSPTDIDKFQYTITNRNASAHNLVDIYQESEDETLWGLGGFVTRHGSYLVLVHTVASDLRTPIVSLDEYDMPQECWFRFDTVFTWLNADTLEEIYLLKYSNFLAQSATPLMNGNLGVVGTSSFLCADQQSRPSLAMIELDGFEPVARYRDSTNWQSMGSGITVLPSGDLVLVGMSMRQLGGKENPRQFPVSGETLEQLRSTGSIEEQGSYSPSKTVSDGYLVVLDKESTPISHLWTEPGDDAYLNAVKTVNGRILVGGKVHGQAFLGELGHHGSTSRENADTVH